MTKRNSTSASVVVNPVVSAIGQPNSTHGIKIAHISDLHFGPSFDWELWDYVREALKHEEPDVIVVSGDVVDSPWPVLLLQAKRELEDLQSNCSDAELFVVPGNHDIAILGNLAIWPFNRFFQSLFLSDTGQLTGIVPDLRSEESGTRAKDLAKRWKAYLLILTWMIKRSAARAVAISYPLFRQIEHIWIAGINSNYRGKSGSEVGVFQSLATGYVEDGALYKIANKIQDLQQQRAPIMIRIGVLHHHALPVSHPVVKEGVTNYEPFLVLRNAGAVIRSLSDNGFDLILHGHKHVHQFARIDFDSGERIGNPMAVLAAGSATVHSGEAGQNSFNIIHIAHHGRMNIRTFRFGGGATANLVRTNKPTPAATFHEDLSDVKRRNFNRAKERQAISCDQLLVNIDVDDFGTATTVQRVEGFQVFGSYKTAGRSYRVFYNQGGTIPTPKLTLDSPSRFNGCTLQSLSQTEKNVHPFRVAFPALISAESGKIDFGFSYSSYNCVALTQWEAVRKGDVPEEWVGALINRPTRIFVMTLKLPEKLADAVPYLKCSRSNVYPMFTLNDDNDIELGTAVSEMVYDAEITKHESAGLHRLGSGLWQLRVEMPLVGYRYEIRWPLPNHSAGPAVAGVTEMYQMNLRDYSDMRRIGDDSRIVKKCRAQFQALYDGLFDKYRSPDPKEKFTVTLMAYDPQAKDLYIVDGVRSWDAPLSWDFRLPLGHGLGGAAFKQRRSIIDWVAPGTNGSAGAYLLDIAESTAATPYRVMMSIPIFHEKYRDATDPPPDAVVGVITIGSDSPGSKLMELSSSPSQKEDVRQLRIVAQTFVEQLLKAYLEPKPTSVTI